MNVPKLLRRFDATLDWLTAVTPEAALDDEESQSFYSSRRSTPFISKRRRQFEDQSPRIRIIHERILKPVDEVTIGDNLQDCLSDMTYIEHVVDEEEDKPLSQIPQQEDRRDNKFMRPRRSRPNRVIERPRTPDRDSSSTPSTCSLDDLHDNTIPTRRKPCTNQSCREARWCGLKPFPRRLQRSPSSVSSRRKDYDVSFIKDAISLVPAVRKDSRHPVRLKESGNPDDECENRQESLRRRKRLSVSIDLPNSDPVYSRQNTPVETTPNKMLNTKRVSEHIRKFGECMDPNSDIGALSFELQNSLCKSASEGGMGEPATECNPQYRSDLIFATADEAGKRLTLFNDEICAHLKETLTTAVDGVHAYLHPRSAVESGRPASPFILPETSEEMRWSMTHSQIEDIWGDEGSVVRIKTVVSSDDRRDGKETFPVASPKSKREQPPQYPSTYFDYVKIKDVPFVQGTDVTIVPTCYIATPMETPPTRYETKLDEPVSQVSSADSTGPTSCVKGDGAVANHPFQDETSSKMGKQNSCNASLLEEASTIPSLKWSPGTSLQAYAKSPSLSREPTGNYEEVTDVEDDGNCLQDYPKSPLSREPIGNYEEVTECLNSDQVEEDGKTLVSFQNTRRSNESGSTCKAMQDRQGHSMIQEHSQEDSSSTTDAIGNAGNSVIKTVSSQHEPGTPPLQDKFTSDFSCNLNSSAMDASVFRMFESVGTGFTSRRGERSPGLSSEPPAPHVDRQLFDSQENPSDLWDGEIEFFGQSSVSSRRQKNSFNKYAGKALQELSQLPSGKQKDIALSGLARGLSSSSEVELSVELEQDTNEIEDETRINEEVSSQIDAPVCDNNVADDDFQEMENIEVVHVEESFEQDDFFQPGGTNGVVFAVFNTDCPDKCYTSWEGESEKVASDTTDNCSNSCSVKENRALENVFEAQVDDASESSSGDEDEYPATFLGVIPGRLSILNQAEISGPVASKRKPADHRSDLASTTTRTTFEAPARKIDTECSDSHPEALRLEATLLEDAKHLTEQAALSLLQPNTAASSVLFFKPTINVFGGESGANDLAALTRAFNKVPDASSGTSSRENLLRPSFATHHEATNESKAQRRFQEIYCDNDDDSFTRELSRLATSERLLREELESFQRKHSKEKTIIDLSMIDDSQCAPPTSDTTSNYKRERGASTCRYGFTSETSTRGVYYSSGNNDFSTSSGGFTSRRSGNLGSRVATPSYPRRLSSSTISYCSQQPYNELQRAPTTVTRNEEAPDRHSIQQMSRFVDPINCCDDLQQQEYNRVNDIPCSTRVNSRISVLRTRLDQKRCALRTAIDMQRGATHVEHAEQEHEQEISFTENGESPAHGEYPDESIEETKVGTEMEPVACFNTSPKVTELSSSLNFSIISSALGIEDTPPVCRSKPRLSTELRKFANSTIELESAGRHCSESAHHKPRTTDFGDDDPFELPQIEVALSPSSLEFTTETGFTFKGVELSSFHSCSTSDGFPDVSVDGAEREKEIEVVLSPKRNEIESETEKEKRSLSGSRSSSYITLSDDSSSFRISVSDGSRELVQHTIPPGLLSSHSTTSSLSLQEHLPVFALQEESSGSLSSRLSLPSIDSSKAEQILVSYREAQHYRDSQPERDIPDRSAPSKAASSASRQRLVRFDLPLNSEPSVSNNIFPDIDNQDSYFPRSDDVLTSPFIMSLLTRRRTSNISDTKADPPGCLEKDPDEYLSGDRIDETHLGPPFSPASHLGENKSVFTAAMKQVKKEEVRYEKKAPSKPSHLKQPPKAPRDIRISVPSKNSYLDKLKTSKDLRKSLLLGHKKKSQHSIVP